MRNQNNSCFISNHNVNVAFPSIPNIILKVVAFVVAIVIMIVSGRSTNASVEGRGRCHASNSFLRFNSFLILAILISKRTDS